MSKTEQLSFFSSLRELGGAVTLGKFLHPASRINEFLLTGEKRMASRANTDLNILARRTGVIDCPARASNIGLKILWMNVGFHLRNGARNLLTSGCLRTR